VDQGPADRSASWAHTAGSARWLRVGAAELRGGPLVPPNQSEQAEEAGVDELPGEVDRIGGERRRRLRRGRRRGLHRRALPQGRGRGW